MIPTPLNCGCTVQACVEMRGDFQLDWAELKCECNTALVRSVSPGVGHPQVNAPIRTHTYTEMVEKEPLTRVTRLSHPPTYLLTEHIFHMESTARRQQKTISQVWQVLLCQALMSVLQKKKNKKKKKTCMVSDSKFNVKPHEISMHAYKSEQFEQTEFEQIRNQNVIVWFK